MNIEYDIIFRVYMCHSKGPFFNILCSFLGLDLFVLDTRKMSQKDHKTLDSDKKFVCESTSKTYEELFQNKNPSNIDYL